ncbi:hypothetical protein INR49_023531 [Caranx melampygus]|nr:hypothetical protein INR49_023531 [Caranx melampygus]
MKSPSSPLSPLRGEHNSIPSEQHRDVNMKWCICMVLIFLGWVGVGGQRSPNSAETNKRCRLCFFFIFLNIYVDV